MGKTVDIITKEKQSITINVEVIIFSRYEKC